LITPDAVPQKYVLSLSRAPNPCLSLNLMLTCYSSSSNETISVAVAQLREAVERIFEDVPTPRIYREELVKCNPAITTLNNKLQSVLKSKTKEDRLAAVRDLGFLLHGEVESMESRLRRAVNAFRVLFGKDGTEMNTARVTVYLAAGIPWRITHRGT